LRPDLRVTLIEPLLRRSTFLGQTVQDLGVGNRVQVIRSRAEDHHQTYDFVVARALAPLDRLIGWCNPLRADGGIILALKGKTAPAEVAAAKPQLRAAPLKADHLTVRAHPEVESATVVRLSERRAPS
jgi:16S rRNA (guanine527-N7)-methyltransferase